MNKQPLLEIKNLSKYYDEKTRALHDVNLTIYKGEIFGLVGESGCGKTTLGRCIVMLKEPSEGSISYNGNDINPKSISKYRSKIQMIFQDPYASLNPKMTAGQIVEEPIKIHQLAKNKEECRSRVIQLLNQVGLDEASYHKYPKEFSGGQRQRIGIARALALEPEFIICDEPISALDVLIQAQILHVLKELQQQKELTYLFIAHDLAVVKQICDRVGVMYLGEIVEIAHSQELYGNPIHPYTKALLSAIPIPDPRKSKERTRIVLEGEASTDNSFAAGCVFAKRCPYVMEQCKKERPIMKERKKGHFTACFLDNL